MIVIVYDVVGACPKMRHTQRILVVERSNLHRYKCVFVVASVKHLTNIDFV